MTAFCNRDKSEKQFFFFRFFFKKKQNQINIETKENLWKLRLQIGPTNRKECPMPNDKKKKKKKKQSKIKKVSFPSLITS
jgi:hypothetical protein